MSDERRVTSDECNGQGTRPSRVINRPAVSRAREAALAAWRVRQFGGDFDPVCAVVEDAVAAFSRCQPEVDRVLWLKVANVIGWDRFREVYHEQLSVMRDSARRGHPLHNPAAAFHKRLQGIRLEGGAA